MQWEFQSKLEKEIMLTVPNLAQPVWIHDIGRRKKSLETLYGVKSQKYLLLFLLHIYP